MKKSLLLLVSSFMSLSLMSFTLTVAKTDVSCFGLNDGSASAQVSGGMAPYTYMWSDNSTSPNKTNLPPGTYSVTVADANGRMLSGSATIIQPPQLITTITQNANVLTSDQAGANYQWIDCGNNNAFISGATSQTFTATSGGSYAVIVSWNSTCSATSSCVQVLAVGIEHHMESSSSWMIYPNPVKNLMNIQINSQTSTLERFRIMDLNGKVVKDIGLSKGENQIDLSDLPAGLYFGEYKGNRKKIVRTE